MIKQNKLHNFPDLSLTKDTVNACRCHRLPNWRGIMNTNQDAAKFAEQVTMVKISESEMVSKTSKYE